MREQLRAGGCLLLAVLEADGVALPRKPFDTASLARAVRLALGTAAADAATEAGAFANGKFGQ